MVLHVDFLNTLAMAKSGIDMTWHGKLYTYKIWKDFIRAERVVKIKIGRCSVLRYCNVIG